jgi:hypothetical protein
VVEEDIQNVKGGKNTTRGYTYVCFISGISNLPVYEVCDSWE